MVRDDDHDEDRVCGLALAHPAAAQLEKLSLSCRCPDDFLHRPRLESLRCGATLRRLELKSCNLEPPTSAPSARLALPGLTDLVLHYCDISEGYLQVLVQAATALANLEMVGVRHKTPEHADPASFTLRLCLRCPTVTALVLDNSSNSFSWRRETLAGSIELDMPSLRTFRYNGCQVELSLTSPMPALEQTDLNIACTCYNMMKQCEPVVSRILRSFSSTRALTLHIDCIEDIVAGEDDGDVILPTFPNLKLLVLDGRYKHMNNDTALEMARLLGSCPVLSELRLRLNMMWGGGCYHESKKEARRAFSVSLDRFNRLAAMASVQESNDIGVSCEISELTDLSSCTLSCLRKVVLRYETNELNCFPVQLAKFLTENAMNLEEMHVDDGSQLWTDHLCNNVPRWRADSFRRKNMPDSGRLQLYFLGSSNEYV
jgi:hypothetical protein